jgi:hypothetical protein
MNKPTARNFTFHATLTLALVAATGSIGCTMYGGFRAAPVPLPPPPTLSVSASAELTVPAAPPPEQPGEPTKVVKEAGPIWSNDDAQTKCPQTCAPLAWEGVWWTTKWNEMSVCECLDEPADAPQINPG